MPRLRPPKIDLEYPHLDVTLIHSLPALSKLGAGLSSGKHYKMLYYDKDRRSRQMNLRTDNFQEAQRLQKMLYAQAEERGCGVKSKMQCEAEAVIKNPKMNNGILFVVHFGGYKSATFATVEKAKEYRHGIALTITQAPPKTYRGRKMRRAGV